MQDITNPFTACLQMFTQPKAVFEAVDKHNNWSWIPFLIVLVFGLGPIYAYFSSVDFDWYREFYASFMAKNVSPAERDMILTPLASKNIYLYSTLFGYFIGYIVIAAVVAIYLHLTTKSDEENVNGFTDWYGFVWWVSLPVVITGFVLFVMVLFSGNQVSQMALQPLSLAYWLGIDESHKWVGIADLFRLDSFASLYLLVVGLKQWTKLSPLRVYLIAIIPFIALILLAISVPLLLE